MKNKSVKKRSLPNRTKWTSKDGGLVKSETEQQQCAGEEYVTGNKNGICVNIHIKEEQTEWELSDKSAEECESGSNLTKELLSDPAANLSKSETDQVNTSHFNLKLKDERNSEFDMVEVKRETELCLKEDSGDKEKQVNATEDVDVGICGGDSGGTVEHTQHITCLLSQ